MDLFIETPRQASERLAREQRSQEAWIKALQQQYEDERRRSAGRTEGDCVEERTSPFFEADARPAVPRSGEYSIAQEAYREELAFDKKRVRRRKRAALIRAACMMLGIPLLLVTVFVGSYVCTCILNGATPEEVGTLLAGMAARVAEFFSQIG